MITPQAHSDTALDRVAGALASEAARTELYRYASAIAEAMPPDSSSWYVVGAVIQVDAVTRNELAALAAAAKRGGTILAGLNVLVQWLPGFGRTALGAAGCACITGCILTVWLWTNAFNAGWGANDAARYIPKEICTSLVNVRHQLALADNRAAVDAIQRQMSGRGCDFSPPEKPKPRKT